AHMRIRSVVIGRVDVEIGRPTDIACKIGQNRLSAIAAPVPVPDVVDVGGTQHDGAAMVRDASAARPVAIGLTISIVLWKVPFTVRDDFLLLRSSNPGRPDTNQSHCNYCQNAISHKNSWGIRSTLDFETTNKEFYTKVSLRTIS